MFEIRTSGEKSAPRPAGATIKSGSGSMVNVFHIGVVGDLPGGIAQVIRQITLFEYQRCTVHTIRSTRGKRDPLAPAFWLIAIVKLAAWRVQAPNAVAIFHLSQGGSFVREGSLALLARLMGYRVGLHLHGSSFVGFANKHRRLVLRVVNLASTVFCLTDQSERAVMALTGDRVRTVKVTNAVTMPIGPFQKKKAVLFAGEVGVRKGVDLLLNAWNQLGAKTVGWRLVVIGPVTIDLKKYPIRPNVEFLGAQPHAVVEDWERDASIAVLPSRNEALPMFLIESMARQCAIVATDTGEVKELVDGVGLVTEVDSTVQLVAALGELIANRSTRDDFGRRAAERIQTSFSAEQCAKTLEDEWVNMSAAAESEYQ